METDAWWGGSEGRTLSETILFEVAALEGVDPLDLPPLFEVVDPESLDELFAGRRSSSPPAPGRSPVTVGFVYHGYRITATSDGTLLVERVDGTEDSTGTGRLRAERVPSERFYGIDPSSRK